MDTESPSLCSFSRSSKGEVIGSYVAKTSFPWISLLEPLSRVDKEVLFL